MAERERMEFDVVIVGGGPAGLACAIRLKELKPDLSVCLLEKGGEIGAHILSGAVIEPRALDELIPDWREKETPLKTPAREDRFLYLTERRAFRLPTPPQMHNEGNFIVSLGDVCRWLGREAEARGVEIYPGFPGADLVEEEGRVVGVLTGDMGVRKDGTPGPNYQPGMELRAAYVVLAEGCRGSLAKRAIARFGLDRGRDPQTYAIGIKELWEIDPKRHQPGLVIHTIGWPLDHRTYGGSFLYHFGENLVSYGFVVGLDYRNPWLSPFEEMQRFKTHPAIRPHFEGGRRLSYGARALVEGGWQALPELVFPGGLIIGDAAGFLHVPKIKGSHMAMKSGMVAAEALAGGLGGAPGAARRLPRRACPNLGDGGAPCGAQHPPGLRSFRSLRRPRQCRARHLSLPRPRPVDAPSPPSRPCEPASCRTGKADHLSQAGRDAHLRPALLGLPQQHQS